ncbi:tetratricopeptide repeat protein [Marinifilum flexuosum]|uniref:tetratricopeptide repeat protein n=1 Tax=Marinifilum flexuosum TaxID=1117708 RepID=UPI002490BB56|nr:tetratricopeptide repeat protein [Marinifilum flexuosum]
MNKKLVKKIISLYNDNKELKALLHLTKHLDKLNGSEIQELLEQSSMWISDNPTTEAHLIKAEILASLDKNKEATKSFTNAIKLDSVSELAYFHRGLHFICIKDFGSSITDFTSAIKINNNNPKSFYYRGLAYFHSDNYPEAIKDLTRVIELNPTHHKSFNLRGKSYLKTKEYTNALNDFSKAIDLNNSVDLYYAQRGIAFSYISEYKKSLNDYSKAIELNPENEKHYYNRAISFSRINNIHKAIDDYTKAIEINPIYGKAYYNRGLKYIDLNKNKEAIINFEKHLECEDSEYWYEKSRNKIKDLQELIKYDSLKVLDSDIDKIRGLLLYEDSDITHFTGLSVTNILLTDKESKFRLSESNFLNDTSEGQKLFNYLFEDDGYFPNGNSISFVSKPFIGSFVPGEKHNDLTLWRMYAKENQQEAKGCSLTLERESFIESIKDTVIPNKNSKKEGANSKSSENEVIDSTSINDNDFKFYRVAYLTSNNSCLIPGADDKQNDLCRALDNLKNGVKEILDKNDAELNQLLQRRLSDIQYLFKGDEYIFESEIRLVMNGIGIEKEFEEKTSPPNVHINIASIKPSLQNITIGPKVEKAEEWAAYFNYNLNGDTEKKVGIQISKLPFK